MFFFLRCLKYLSHCVICPFSEWKVEQHYGFYMCSNTHCQIPFVVDHFRDKFLGVVSWLYILRVIRARINSSAYIDNRSELWASKCTCQQAQCINKEHSICSNFPSHDWQKWPFVSYFTWSVLFYIEKLANQVTFYIPINETTG